MSKFPVRVYVKETHANGDFFWKSLCVVYDNEALGLLERMLSSLELKIEPIEYVRPNLAGYPGLSND
jgi:hypothetical protein